MEHDMKQEKTEKQTEELEVMFEHLERVIAELESDDVSLEQSFMLYNRGMSTIKKCNETIDMVEKKVQVIDQNGAYHEL